MTTAQDTPTGIVTLARHKEIAGSEHPWIYAGFIHAVRGQPASGDLVDVVMPNSRFYGRGLYNPSSKIRIRLLTFQEETITQAFWSERIAQAVRLRAQIVSQTTAYRLIYGRTPTLEEVKDARQFLTAARGSLKETPVVADKRNREAWASFMRVLLSSNEFLFID